MRNTLEITLNSIDSISTVQIFKNMAEEKINLFDLGNINNTCSDSSDSEITKAKIIQRFKRKLSKKKQESESDSENDHFSKRRCIDQNLPKYYEGNSIQNQEGYFGGLMDINVEEEYNQERYHYFYFIYIIIQRNKRNIIEL